ncbi:dolichyl-P-Man:Man(5)GlcNAc(2)-PP-dolichyl mannosyltransferase [Paramyrothecium foliicola]|nr:dolichyl-P-Man:Man(5)GlcNAc(2)-PP-dolichyl mannosyltransferase [Paramyrothecium foliicola]
MAEHFGPIDPSSDCVATAGVSGLTSALLLSKSKANVITVVAKHMPGDYDIEYASPWAGANVMPMASAENSRWERRTWPELKRLTVGVPEAGIHFQTLAYVETHVYRRNKDLDEARADSPDALFDKDPWFKNILDNYRELRDDEVIPGHDSGCEFTSICINTAIYLPWLVGQCLKNGVVFKRGVLTHISEAKSMSHSGKKANFIINTTGLGALALGGVADAAMAPVRAQIVLVRNEFTPMYASSGTDDGPTEILYLMQRAAGGGTILGGTYDIGNWDPVPDPDIAARIMKRVVEAHPTFADGKGVEGLSVIRHGVGLRPYRKGGVRIEEERLDDETWIVHNYGHAGWGYQGSYGCAEGVVQLVNSIREQKGQNISSHFSESSSNANMTQNGPPLPLQAWNFVADVSTGRHALSKLIAPALWLADAVLCGLIIWKVPYTEIDWVAYMEQVSQFVKGERDYTKMEGGTGPLVYPGAHVYTYTGLYYLTDEGKDIRLAQQLFAVLYMATLAVVMLCYKQAKVPPYVFPLLILSKRLHSVFVLRCFNDCFAAFFLWLAIYCFQRRYWTFGSMIYSWGLGIKMSLLLVLPAVAVVLFLGRGFKGSLSLVWLMTQLQMLIAVPFLAKNPTGYLGRAFELSRQFKFEWTVNWRMVGEEVFLSRSFSVALLGFHVTILLVFLTTRWLRPAGRSLFAMIPSFLQLKSPFTQLEELRISHYVTPEYVMTTILSANVIGLLFARSLHYQFYAYLAWSTPYLLWRTSPHPILIFPLWLAQEWAWNVFPSTPASSAVVVDVLIATVALTYFGTAKEEDVMAEKRVPGRAEKKD